MLSVRSIIFSLAFTIIALLFVWWRWVYLPTSDIPRVRIDNQAIAKPSPLDILLKKEFSTLQGSPALLMQLRRQHQTRHIAPLWVSRCEVTQGEFRRFAHWRAAQTIAPAAHPRQPKSWEYKSQTEDHRILGQLDVSAGGLSFYDAWAYCRASGGRLPGSDEWEAIASGTQRRLYPWGNTFVNEAWRYTDPSLNIAESCEISPATASPEGIQALGSSLLEWTEDEQGSPVLMGGNAYNRPYALHALNFIRRPASADYRSQFTGFRCVYPAQEAGASQLALPLPWGETVETIKIVIGETQIGAPKESKIVELLRHLNGETLSADLAYFPISAPQINGEMMRHEVTREQYARFLRDPLVHWGLFNHPRHPSHVDHTPGNWQEQRQQRLFPVTHITWWSAWAFANWIGGQLPSAEQWQALAGRKLTTFPYGNTYIPGRAIDFSIRHSVSAGDSDDASADGIIGFGGNVAEWTNTSVLRNNSFSIVVKGGSYLMPAEGTQVSQTSEALPDYHSADLGFRVFFPQSRKPVDG